MLTRRSSGAARSQPKPTPRVALFCRRSLRIALVCCSSALGCLVVLGITPSDANARTTFGSNGCGTSEYEPTEIVLTCGDAKLRFKVSEWTAWKDDSASATGFAYHPNTAAPECRNKPILACPYVEIAATATLFRPALCPSNGRWQFTRFRMLAPGDPEPDTRDLERDYRCNEYAKPKRSHSPRPYFRECPPQRRPLENGILQRHRLSCAKARKLVIGFMDDALTLGVLHARIEGFRCKNVPPSVQPGIVCARGQQRARYLGYPPRRANPRAIAEAEPRAFMSCGYPPTRSFGITSKGAISYREHPARCSYSDDGTTRGTISLAALTWSGWGKPTARAVGKRVDNHDQDNNGFQRHNVRVILSGLRPAVGHQGLRKVYYSRLQVYFGGGETHTWPLYRPGMGVIRPRLGSMPEPDPRRRAASQINECGDLPSRFAYNVTTRKAACWKAREVIRRWGNTVAQEGGDGFVGAYYCRYKNIGYEAGDIRCTASRGRVVHWQTGV